MAFIGNTNTTQAFTPAIDYFSGNASTTAFTLSRPVASVAQVQAVVNNVAQNPSDAFTVSGNTITFTSAPSSGTNNIYVYYTSPITQVIAPSQGTVGTTQLQGGLTVNFADGTAAAPSITNDGDTNTGIFFPAADTIAFAEGGAEIARFDSSGNFLVGTTSNTGVDTGSQRLVVNGIGSNGAALGVIADTVGRGIRVTDSSKTYTAVYDMTTTLATLGTNQSIPLAFTTNGSERMRIDSSGNVGIGATSGGNRLLVSKNDNTYYLTDFNNTLTSGNGYINRMLFGASAPNSTASIFSAMVDTGGSRCIIYANGGIHNYQANNANLSDRREKTNFAPAGEYLSKICAIPVQTFNYIDQNIEEDAGLTLGVIAQDVQAVAPELVMESNWGTEEDPKMRLSIYQTDLQYALMKCIQEQQALITALTTRIEALENK
jgi:hypothetical protein